METGLNSTPDTRPSRIRPWQSLRWPIALVGLALLVAGQVVMVSQTLQLGAPLALGIWLNDHWHLSIPSIDHILYGLLLELVGVALLAAALRGLRLLPLDERPLEIRPFAIRLIRPAWPWVLIATLLFAALLFQVDATDTRPALALLWIASLLIFTSVMAVWDRRRGVSASPHLGRRDLVWMFGLVIAGLLIGAYRLQGWPDMLVGDEGNFWTVARDLANGSLHASIFGNGVYSFPVFSSFLQDWVLKLFGIDLWGWRFGSVLMGVATVIPLYLLAREAFDRKVAIVASIVMLASPYFLAFARLGYNNIQALFITVLALYWLYAGLQRGSNLLTFLAGVACGLGFYTFFSARGAVVIALAYVVLLWWTRKFHFKQAAHAVLLIGLGMLLVIVPYFLYGAHQDSQALGFKTLESVFFNTFNGEQFYTDAQLFRYAPPITLGGNQLFFNPPIYFVLLMRGLIRSLLVFQIPGLVTEHFIAVPLAGNVGAVFYVIGMLLVLRTVKQPRSQLLLLWFLMNLLGFSALNTVPPRHTHMVAIIPDLAILTALGILALARAAGFVHAWIGRHRDLLAAVLLVAVAAGGLVDYFVLAPAQYLPPWDQILSWTALTSRGERLVFVYTDPSLDGFQPYIVSEFRKQVPYASVPLDQFLTDPDVGNARGTLVFYPPELAARVEPVLAAIWGKALIQRTFYGAGQVPILSVGMNVPFMFERDRSFAATLLDAFRRPSYDVLLLLLLLGLAAVIFLPAAWLARLPRALQPPLAWFTRPAPPGPIEWPEQDFAQFEASLPVRPLPAAQEPPEWAAPLTRSLPTQPPDRLSGNLKTVRGEHGRDLYVRLHFPSLRLSHRRLTESLELSLPPINIPGAALLGLAVTLAVFAQVCVGRAVYLPGAILYLGAAAGLFVWAGRHPKWNNVLANQLRLSRSVERLILVGIVAAAAVARFVDLGRRVYGLDGVEAAWTIQSWYSAILRVAQGDLAVPYYQYLPVDFWVRAFFLRLFGVDFAAARVEAAVFSLLSVVLLYLLVRRLSSSPPLALLASLLYAFAFVELNAAHQALSVTVPEVWLLAAATAFVYAVLGQKWWQFQLTGILLAVGLMTYETFFPLAAVLLAYAVGLAVFRLLRRQDPLRYWIMQLLLLAWPVLLVSIDLTSPYLQNRAPILFGWTRNLGWSGADLAVFGANLARNGTNLLQTLFAQLATPDALLNWNGPFLNPLVLPSVVIGLVYNLWNLRRPLFALFPAWFLGTIVAGALLPGSVQPAWIYPALVPLIVWAAMGLWTLLGALRAWFDGLKVPVAVPVFVLLLAALVFNDYHIYSTALLDPPGNMQRRELADLAAQSARQAPMVLFTYEKDEGDLMETESQLLLFAVGGARREGLGASGSFAQVPLPELLPVLWQDRAFSGLDLVYDKSVADTSAARAYNLNLVLSCYPGARLQTSGQYFDVYHLDAAALSQPRCYQPPAPVAVSPQDGATLPPGGSLTLTWDAQGTQFKSYEVFVDQKVSGTYLIEAEDAFRGSGWYSSSSFVGGYSGSGFLLDNWQAGVAQADYSLPQSGRYNVWVRFYKRRDNDQHNYISLGGQTVEFAGSGEPLNAWTWAQVGTFDLSQGSLPISLSRSYGKDEQYSVFIDSVLLTQDLTDAPDQIPEWQPVIDSQELPGTASSFTLEQVLPAGQYRWRVRIFNAYRVTSFTGARGVESADANFTVQP